MFRIFILFFDLVLFIYVFIAIRKTFKVDSIRLKIRRSVSLVVLFLIVMAFSVVTVFFWDTSTLYTRDQMNSISHAKMHHVDDLLENVGENVRMLSAGNPYRDMFDTSLDYTYRYDQLKRRISTSIAYHEDFENIKVISKDGYILASSVDDEGTFVGDKDLIKSGLTKLTYGNPHKCDGTDMNVLPVVSPILLENEVEGVLLVNFNMAAIDDILQMRDGVGDSGELYIINGANYAISSLDGIGNDDIYPLDEDLYSDLKRELDYEDSAYARTDDYIGENVELSITKSKLLDWYLVAQIDHVEAFSYGYLFLGLELILISLVLIVGRVGSFKIANTIARPVEDLTKNVSVVIKGNLKQKVDIKTPDEIGKLSRYIDDMAKTILSANKSVDKKVKEQTNELDNQKALLRNQQLALLNILEDVSVEKDEIDKQRNKLDIILEGIGDGVFAIDKDYRITRFNKVASDISGFDADSVIGKRCRDVLVFRREKDDSLYYDFIEKAITTGKVQSMANHTYLERKDGTHVSVADSAAPIKDVEGNILGCVVVFRDVTKELEINKMKDEFVSVASHQLRTPLTGIKWYIQLLLKKETGKLNSQQTNFIRSIYDSNERMIKLVDDLLSVSRIDTGRKFSIKKKKVDIVKPFKDVINVQSVIARKRGVEIECQKSCPKSIVVDVDVDKIVEVFANVLSNAIKYSHDNGKVRVSVKEEKDSYIFAVKDEGLGIPKAVQEKIFEKFFRADNVKKHQVGGNGLGLYIAKSIMTAHGGDIWFESKVNKGTTFYIKISK